ncbi:hypothetical protein GCM10010431_47060 [Streptomyces kunmingensis]
MRGSSAASGSNTSVAPFISLSPLPPRPPKVDRWTGHKSSSLSGPETTAKTEGASACAKGVTEVVGGVPLGDHYLRVANATCPHGG